MTHKDLVERVNQIAMKEGTQGKARLSFQSGASATTIEVLRKGAVPKPGTAYRLAVAASFSEEDASAIAEDVRQIREKLRADKARETA